MKKKGFTLIELLVVIAIIAMLMAILMPALGKVKRMAERIVCGSNLRGLGNAIAVYASDYDDEYPVHLFDPGSQSLGPARSGWSNPDLTPRELAGRSSTEVTVEASLYLLVREADVDPKVFVCKSSDETAFEGADNGNDMVELWGFGAKPRNHVSYSYQLPYKVSDEPARPISGSSDPSMAVLADKSPWCDETLEFDGSPTADNYMTKVASYASFTSQGDIEGLENLTKWQQAVSNSANHQREGQNVLFNDMHVTFEKRADVGARQDNIWMAYRERVDEEWNRRAGEQIVEIISRISDPKKVPQDRMDNVLVSSEQDSANALQ